MSSDSVRGRRSSTRRHFSRVISAWCRLGFDAESVTFISVTRPPLRGEGLDGPAPALATAVSAAAVLVRMRRGVGTLVAEARVWKPHDRGAVFVQEGAGHESVVVRPRLEVALTRCWQPRRPLGLAGAGVRRTARLSAQGLSVRVERLSVERLRVCSRVSTAQCVRRAQSAALA